MEKFIMPKQLRTPKKNRIRGTADFCERRGIPYTKADIGRVFDAIRRQVDYALKDYDDNRRTQLHTELRGNNTRKLIDYDLIRVKRVIEENGPEGHDLSWYELVQQFSFNVTTQTL
jgi:hypothetical protein